MRLSYRAPLLLAYLLNTTSAFIPVAITIDSLPTDLDTNVWIPISTIYPTPTPTNFSPEEDLPGELRIRQATVIDVAPTATPQAGDQVSPVTTYQANEIKGGVAVQVQVVYTQLFVAVPDQWPSPSAGSIGMGTIQGEIGVVRTKGKRSEPTQMPKIEAKEEHVIKLIFKHDDGQEGVNTYTYNYNPEATPQPRYMARYTTLLPVEPAESFSPSIPVDGFGLRGKAVRSSGSFRTASLLPGMISMAFAVLVAII